ncbi:MAG: hypothetical protein LBR54_01980 [Oscillospiraceae bacterium]|jgi:hypothetical protein|nr:hypothetical protein [Oscillospiraceae bacterium]
MLLKSAEIEPSRSYAEDLDEGVLSKFRTGDMQIYERILLDYKKSDILSRIKPYFEKNVTHYILSDQIYDLKEELKNIIEAYKDVRFDTKSSG